VDIVAKRNPIVCNGKIHPQKLKEWIRNIEKIFVVLKVPRPKGYT